MSGNLVLLVALCALGLTSHVTAQAISQYDGELLLSQFTCIHGICSYTIWLLNVFAGLISSTHFLENLFATKVSYVKLKL